MTTTDAEAASAITTGTTLPTLYYVYDALCGWCFGMSPGIVSLRDSWQGRLNFEVLSGGMVTGSRIGPATDMAQYIRGAHKRVEEMAGVKFGRAFLDGTLSNPEAIFNSIKPSQALTAAKQLRPDVAVSMAHAIQQAIYVDGQLPDVWATYEVIAIKLGLNDDGQFLALAQSDVIEKATQAEFGQVQAWGVTGFPTLVLDFEDKLYLLSQGFSPAKSISERIERVLGGQV